MLWDVLRLFLVLVCQWCVNDLKIPPPGAQLSAEKGDQLAPGGRPNAWTKHISAFTLLLGTLQYGRWYWRDDALSSLEIAAFCATLVGWALRDWACRALGHLHTFDLGTKKEHELVRSGPYRWLVHPSYTGQLLCYAGTFIFLHVDSVVSLPVMAFALYTVLRRSSIEERALLDKFGDEYAAYRSKRWKYVPFLY